MPSCAVTLKGKKAAPKGYVEHPRNLGEHLMKRRMDAGLSRPQLGRKIGVRGQTISTWERGMSCPEARYWPVLYQFLGFDPDPPPRTLSDRVWAARQRLGLTQAQFAERAGLGECTIRHWESGGNPDEETLQRVEAFLRKTGV